MRHGRENVKSRAPQFLEDRFGVDKNVSNELPVLPKHELSENDKITVYPHIVAPGNLSIITREAEKFKALRPLS